MAEQDPTAETWKPIPEYHGYEVSDLGRVRSLDRMVRGNSGSQQPKLGRVLANEISARGYACVRFWLNGGGSKKETIGRIVLRIFVRPGIGKEQADHINFDRLDNRLVNLRWLTPKENIAHTDRSGRRKLGERHHNSKLSNETVREIRRRRALGETQKSIAADYGVNQTTISEIDCGHYWKHVS